MKLKKLLFCIFSALISLTAMNAQDITVRGTVIDFYTQKPLEYIPVYIKHTATGCLTNYDGEFYLKESSGADTLVVEAIGYGKFIQKLKPGSNSTIKVVLKPENVQLVGAVVKPKRERYVKKENPAVELIRNVIANKKHNRIEDKEYYACNLYEKLTLSLDDYQPDFEKKKKMEYLKQYIDTSEITGKPIFTFSIREHLCDYYYRKSPKAEKTIRKASTHTGFDKEFDHNGGLSTTLEQVFTGVDIFDNEITFLANRFVSPLSTPLATVFYKYYIMDTVKVDNVPCIDLAFVPYNSQALGFTGRLYITNDGKYSVKKIQMNFPSSSNVNWIDKLRVDQEFQQTPEGLWALKREDSYVNLAVIEGKQGVFAHQTRCFTNHSFDVDSLQGHKAYTIDGPLEILPDAKKYTEEYWAENREVPLNHREEQIEAASKDLRDKSSLTFWMKVLDAIVSEYVPTSSSKSTSKFDFGSVFSIAGYNHVEKFRMRVGGMTTANLCKNWFANGFVAYGFEDPIKSNRFKYGLKVTHSFNEKHYHAEEKPLNNISLAHSFDIYSPEILMDQNGILTSLKAAQPTKLQYIRRTTLQYDRQWTNSFRTHTWLEGNHYQAATIPGDEHLEPRLQSLRYNLVNADGTTTQITGGIHTAEFGATFRWAPGERIFNSTSQRANIDKDTPILTLTHRIGAYTLGAPYGVHMYNKTEFNAFKRFRLSFAGFLDARVAAGAVWNSAPWPLLVIAEANQSFSYRRESFHMLNALEFINDRSVQFNLTWHMKGMILNRIPLIKKLNLREIVILNGVYGTLTEKNDPRVTPGLLALPAGWKELSSMPYLEAGIGLENVFRLLRIAYFFRLPPYHNDEHLTWMQKWGGLRFGVYVDF